MSSSRNIKRHVGHVDADQRASALGQRGVVVWLTGLSGSGKSTVAFALERELIERGIVAFVLDGDNVRHGLNADLGFSPEQRRENIRRISEVAALFADAGVISITSFISPYRADRQRARQTVGDERFVEVHLDVPVEICEQRDPKGLYQRARRGEIADFTGVSAPYEPPESAQLTLSTATTALETCVAQLIGELEERGFIPVVS